jgi:hypothetical protein
MSDGQGGPHFTSGFMGYPLAGSAEQIARDARRLYHKELTEKLALSMVRGWAGSSDGFSSSMSVAKAASELADALIEEFDKRQQEQSK